MYMDAEERKKRTDETEPRQRRPDVQNGERPACHRQRKKGPGKGNWKLHPQNLIG